MNQYDVSVIVTTWNSVAWIQRCLESLLHQEGVHLEVIAVDNGSTDGTPEEIRRFLPYGRHLFLESNVGPARARNLAIRKAQGRYILTLDHDVELGPDFIRNLLSVAEASPAQVGMWSGKILKPDRKTLDSTGIVLSKQWRAMDRGQNRIAEGKWDQRQNILGPSACAALYRRSMLEEIKDEYGYFDERFFFLWEDVELAWRAQSKGWRAVYVPLAVAIHARNGSSLPMQQRQILSFRNRYLFIRKHRLWHPLHRFFLDCGPYEMLRFLLIVSTNPLVFSRYFLKSRPFLGQPVS